MGPTKSLDGPGYKTLSARLYYNNNILYALQLHGLLMAGMFSQLYTLTAPTSLLNRTPTSLPDCTPSRAYPTVQPKELTRTLYHFNQLPWIKKKKKKVHETEYNIIFWISNGIQRHYVYAKILR